MNKLVILSMLLALIIQLTQCQQKQDGKFENLIHLTKIATKLAYINETYNEYLDKSGWELFKRETPINSMNAISWINKNESSLLISFRGTTSKADRCADELLFNPEKKEFDDPDCKQYKHLNYLQLANDFYISNTKSLKNYNVLLTGHSLGCSLSELTALQSKEAKAFGYGCAGIDQIIKHNKWKNLNFNKIYQIANKADPIVKLTFSNQTGNICYLNNTPSPISCKVCFLEEKNIEKPFCEVCFAKVHLFSNYLHLLESSNHYPKKCQTLNFITPREKIKKLF